MNATQRLHELGQSIAGPLPSHIGHEYPPKTDHADRA